MSPQVSVITRTKDRPVLLSRAIESVTSQSYKAIEHVIVNDGGDASRLQEVLTASGHSNCIVINNSESVGMEAASNIGIGNSTGEYIVIHDDDDSWHSTFLEEVLNFLLSQPSGLDIEGAVSLSNLVIEQLGENHVETLSVSQYNSGAGLISLNRMAYVNQYPPISFVFSRAAYNEIGGFNEALPVLGDWDFYLRFLSRFNIAILPKHLANYHQRPYSDGIYGNTVVAQKPIHLLYDTFLRNQYARNPEVIGLLPSLLVSLAVSNDQKSEKKRKDLDCLTKSCLSLMNDRPDRVYIFGASEYGLFCKDLLADHVKVEGFIDNFHHGLSRVDGYPVFKLDGLSGLAGAAVLVSSVGNREVIIDQLRQSPGGAAMRIY